MLSVEVSVADAAAVVFCLYCLLCYVKYKQIKLGQNKYGFNSCMDIFKFIELRAVRFTEKSYCNNYHYNWSVKIFQNDNDSWAFLKEH